MTEVVRTLRIEVTEWPEAANFNPEDSKYQYDIFENGDWVGGGTGPGDAVSLAEYAIEHYQEWRREEGHG